MPLDPHTDLHSCISSALTPQLLKIDKETNRGSWIFFGVLLFGLILISILLPSVSYYTKVMQIARIVALLGIFSLLSFSLNNMPKG